MESNALLLRPLMPLLVDVRSDVEVRACGRHFDLADIDELGLATAVLFEESTDLPVEGESRAIEDLAVQLVDADLHELPEPEDVLVLPLIVDHDRPLSHCHLLLERGALKVEYFKILVPSLHDAEVPWLRVRDLLFPVADFEDLL